MNMKEKPNAVTSFFRYNIVAIIATSVDFAVLVFFTEVLQYWYLFSALLGALAGGTTAFVLGRNWVFMPQNGRLGVQTIRYMIVWTISIILNILSLFLLVEYCGLQYIISKIIVAMIIGIGFNFFMNKYFIFG